MHDMVELEKFGIDIQTNVLLKNKTWLGVGGPAEFYIDVNDEEKLVGILRYAHEHALPITFLGAGSNVLIRDGGIDGLVIHLGKKFTSVTVQDNILSCGAAASLMEISKIAADHCISGFEFMSGIPGTLGGGIKTNAGAYGSDLGKIITELVGYDYQGNMHKYFPQQENVFEYRHCKLPNDMVFVFAKLCGKIEANNTQILQQMQSYKEKRQASQPQGVRTAGSTFKNPADHVAWKLLNEVGLRGYTENDAQFSEKHPNFLINKGTASAHDLEKLIILAQKKVLDKTGIQLECEVQILGKEKE